MIYKIYGSSIFKMLVISTLTYNHIYNLLVVALLKVLHSISQSCYQEQNRTFGWSRHPESRHRSSYTPGEPLLQTSPRCSSYLQPFSFDSNSHSPPEQLL